VAERLEAKHKGGTLVSRKIEYSDTSDPMEVCYQRGWTDGLPVTPPTDERVLEMLKGTRRRADEVVGKIPPYLGTCTVEKVTINAVLAGCKPEYMPVLLAALEAALEPVFTLHGVLATTYFSSPIIIVNGPIARAIGMNSGLNVLGQGNRANATIGRALNLIVQNVGGGRPGEADRSTLGAPSKYTLCFAEDESDPEWEPLSVARGFPRGVSTVTLFQGHGPEAIVDQKTRTAEGLTRSIASSLVKMGIRSWCSPRAPCWCLRPSTTRSTRNPAGIARRSSARSTRRRYGPAGRSWRARTGWARACPRAAPRRWSRSSTTTA